MIEWFTWLQVAVATAAGLLCVALGLARRAPNDVTIGATAVVEVLLVIQLIVALIAPVLGNAPTGNAIEFALYLGFALLVPPLTVFWALIDRTRWSTVILGVACLSVAVMVYRMHQIWTVQLA